MALDEIGVDLWYIIWYHVTVPVLIELIGLALANLTSQFEKY